MAEFDLAKYSEVIDFMKAAHGNQMRAFTKVPYWTHPVRVANLVMKYKKSHEIDNIVIAALLHDVLEDTDKKWHDLPVQDIALNLIIELTSDPIQVKEKGKALYLTNKMIEMSSWGLVIKLCDRLDNVTDFVFCPPKFILKYGKETDWILDSVRRSRELSKTHSQIIDDIYKILEVYYDRRESAK